MQRICLFPGTFDPVTLGHVDIINRALPLFDKIYVGIGINASKSPMFSAEQRMKWVADIYANEPKVVSVAYTLRLPQPSCAILFAMGEMLLLFYRILWLNLYPALSPDQERYMYFLLSGNQYAGFTNDFPDSSKTSLQQNG